MTVIAETEPHTAASPDNAAEHLWMHFTRMGNYATGRAEVPVITRGEGAYIYDAQGRRYLDALSGLFVVQAGYGREEIVDAIARQTRELAYFPIWSYATPPAIELANRLAALAPGDLNKVFFSSGGSESVETAWKVAKQYFKLTGKPGKTKVISRAVAYHGVTQGALSITGVPNFKHAYEPLVPGAVKVPNTDFYHAPEHLADDEKAFGRWAADRFEEAILAEGADSVCAVFVEPVQNAGGSIPPPAGYFERLREICDHHDVLLVSDEVICAYGRLGTMFGAQKFGYQPDIITTAKGLTSGYSPLGAAIISDRIFEPFGHGTTTFAHGYTFGGHPGACAGALANLDLFEREDLLGNVLRNEHTLESTLGKLLDLPIVGDVRGSGFFWSVELVKSQATREPFNRADCERILRGVVAPGLWDAGVYCRADDRGQAVVQFAPPLICGPAEFDQIEQAMRSVLTDAWAGSDRSHHAAPHRPARRHATPHHAGPGRAGPGRGGAGTETVGLVQEFPAGPRTHLPVLRRRAPRSSRVPTCGRIPERPIQLPADHLHGDLAGFTAGDDPIQTYRRRVRCG